MKRKISSISIILVVLIFLVACNKGPKVISSSTESENIKNSSGIFDAGSSPQSVENTASTLSTDIHSVVVNEILPASKYDYLRVTEDNEQFWIAVRKQVVKVGETYFYKRALRKTNFESKELNKMFKEIFLVSSLVQANHGNNAGTVIQQTSDDGHNHASESKSTTSTTINVVQKEGSIKISELVKNQKNLEGKTVQITGKCIKVNPNIMNRNWIHLKDGTNDDFDMVITSTDFVPEGLEITMKGTVTLNKDFGAGYKYDLILENGSIVR